MASKMSPAEIECTFYPYNPLSCNLTSSDCLVSTKDFSLTTCLLSRNTPLFLLTLPGRYITYSLGIDQPFSTTVFTRFRIISHLIRRPLFLLHCLRLPLVYMVLSGQMVVLHCVLLGTKASATSTQGSRLLSLEDLLPLVHMVGLLSTLLVSLLMSEQRSSWPNCLGFPRSSPRPPPITSIF